MFSWKESLFMMHPSCHDLLLNGIFLRDGSVELPSHPLYYLLQKGLSRKLADKHLKNLLKIFHLAPVNRAVLVDAIAGKFTDYEDSVLHQSVKLSGLDAILTRNQKDFKNSTLPVYSPKELLNLLDALT